jgi:hypothetical protein
MATGPCPYCGDWPDDDNRVRNYCRPCHAERTNTYNRRRRQAALGASLEEIGTARPDRMRILASAIVDRFGGYDKAAAEIVAYVRELAKSGKAPAQAMRTLLGIVKLLHAAGRPD